MSKCVLSDTVANILFKYMYLYIRRSNQKIFFLFLKKKKKKKKKKNMLWAISQKCSSHTPLPILVKGHERKISVKLF